MENRRFDNNFHQDVEQDYHRKMIDHTELEIVQEITESLKTNRNFIFSSQTHS
jgi:hypothetical protein